MRITTPSPIGASAVSPDFVASDFLALASHMTACERSTVLTRAQASFEVLHGLAASRIVTTGALFAACGIVLLSFA